MGVLRGERDRENEREEMRGEKEEGDRRKERS